VRRIVLIALAALLGLASHASAAVITNGTVTLGVNPSGDLNATDPVSGAVIGVTYNATGNDGTRGGCLCEGWGAGAGATSPSQFEGRANEELDHAGTVQGPFTSTADSAVSTVDILRGDTPALRLTQDYHPSPTTPNLYEITTTLTNISGGPLNDVRYERVMDWDVEPSPTQEYVTINRGSPPPGDLIYSDDNGFADNFPFSDRGADSGNGPITADTLNADVVDSGPADHGARFTFSFGGLAAGESRQFFVYYGAAGNETDANAAVSAAALEVFSYGQPSRQCAECDPSTVGATEGTPNTFIWGFRGVGGTAVFPPTLTLSPKSASSTAGGSHTVTATLAGSDGSPVPGADLVFSAAGANTAGGAGVTDGGGQASFSYTGGNAGDDTITACLDADSSGGCDPGEVTDTATQHWDAPPPPPVQQVAGTTQSLVPVLGRSVVAGVVSGRVRFKTKHGKFRTLGAGESIPVGSTVDATKGKVRLTSAANASGATQSSLFYQGAFVVTQTKGTKPITQLALSGALSCGTAGKASAAAKKKKKKVRRLWGDGHGSFRTKGRSGAATVRGTKWLTEDRCDGTLVRVKRGVVQVRDFAKRKTVIVKKGHSYLARAKAKKKKRKRH
jgi:Bacterial Ig-like domain (group 1)